MLSTSVGNTLTQRTGLSSDFGGDDAASSFSGSGFGDDGSPTHLNMSRRISIRHMNPPEDGHFLDADFEEVCRATVAAEKRRMVMHTMRRSQQLQRVAEDVIGGESVFRASPERLANFFKTEGAVYSRYDLSSPFVSGGALPQPWTAVRSRTTGRTYYANTDTGETQWEPPLYPLSREWTMHTSPQSGAVFYVNKETGKAQWDRPVDEMFLDLQAGHTDAEALKIWRERNEKAEYGFAGLEYHPDAQATLLALPCPPYDEEDGFEPMQALPAPETPALSAQPAPMLEG